MAVIVRTGMDIYLHNTLTGKKEKFEPIKSGHVSMYNCGPTVYHYAHIGNLRSYVFADLLRRMFERNGYEVRQVINITDVGHLVSDADTGEDKMEKGARREGKTAREVADFYTGEFFRDLDDLNIPRENIIFPKATDYIQQQIEMVTELERKGYTYRTSDGIYFDTNKFPDYGILGGINLSGLQEGARIGVNAEKKQPTDFALWKFSPTGHKREMEWDSPWGVGFPGWHIECSAMVKKLLGDTIDLHTGGIDHIPVHHNNEIAQSVCANGAPLARYWMHNNFLVGGEEEKMSKSGDNFIRLQTLRDRGISPLAYRYLLLTARYSSPLQFSWEALQGAQSALERLHDFCTTTTDDDIVSKDNIIIEEYNDKFMRHISDDLDTPQALALVWEIVKDKAMSHDTKRDLILDFDGILGLRLDEIKTFDIPDEVKVLMQERDRARAEKDFAKSDELRLRIESLGFEVMDTTDGTKVSKKLFEI